MKLYRRVCAAALAASVVLAVALALPGVARAGDSPGDKSPPASPEDKLDTGDNAWLLTSSALVLMMTGPGLALFYCGLVRKKNVLSVMMQCAFLMCLMSVLWGLYGYTVAFGGYNDTKVVRPWLGDFRYLFMIGGQAQWSNGKPYIPIFPGLTIPVMTHMLFQGMFAVITPALICGAFAERMKFSTMVVFMILWATIVYFPLAHWVWGGGILCYGSDCAVLGGAWISPEGPWSISVRAFPPWSAPWSWARGSATAKSQCPRTTSPTRLSEPRCSG